MKRYGLITFLAAMLTLATFSVAYAQGGHMHRVGYGDTLYSIAAHYGVSVDSIMRQNGLANPNMIYAGQALRIPGGYYTPGYQPNYGAGSGCGNYHVVRPGETLSSIAYQYGYSIRDVLAMNSLYNRDMVYAGQRLCMPGGGYAPQPANTYYHNVAYGETLYQICDRYGVSYDEVVRVNGLANAGYIREGQRLHIPGYHPAPASLPAPPPIVEEIVVEEVFVDHAPPAYAHAAPPPAPVYGGGDQVHVIKPSGSGGASPPAPEYQPVPEKPLLPEASHPIEVVVNGGSVWRGEVYPNSPDPNGDTILIVSTRESDKPIVWLRSGDYEVKGELGLVPEYGVDQYRFAFRYIPPGDYDVWFEDPEGTPSEKVPVEVEPAKRVEVNFRKGVGFSGPTYASPDGWVLANWENPSRPGENIGGWSNILVRTPASGLNVKIESEGGGYTATCFTGTKGPGACDFAGLNAGIYYIWIDGTQLTLKTYMDGAAYAEFEFARQPSTNSADRDKVGPVSYSD